MANEWLLLEALWSERRSGSHGAVTPSHRGERQDLVSYIMEENHERRESSHESEGENRFNPFSSS